LLRTTQKAELEITNLTVILFQLNPIWGYNQYQKTILCAKFIPPMTQFEQ